MLLTPSYDGPPAIAIDGPADDVLVPFLRQRRRLGDLLSGLTEDQWAAPSRCEGWSVQDVVAHLDVVNGFWALSIGAGLAGEPTRYLAAFDPVASPAEAAPAMRSRSSAEALDRLLASTQAIAELIEPLDADGWSTLAEAPPGHLPIRLVVTHGLWDAWVHERDILLPLGLSPAEEPDEVYACLRYAAALGPSFSLRRDVGRAGALVFDCPDVGPSVVVEVDGTVSVHAGPAPDGAAHLQGTGVRTVEALSLRGEPIVSDVPESHRWLVDGLATTFDTRV